MYTLVNYYPFCLNVKLRLCEKWQNTREMRNLSVMAEWWRDDGTIAMDSKFATRMGGFCESGYYNIDRYMSSWVCRPPTNCICRTLNVQRIQLYNWLLVFCRAWLFLLINVFKCRSVGAPVPMYLILTLNGHHSGVLVSGSDWLTYSNSHWSRLIWWYDGRLT